MVRPALLVVPTRYIAVIYVLLIGGGLLLPLLVGRREHLEELVQTHCHRTDEWLPSISAATGDKTPERFIWRYALVFGMGFRILSSFSVFSHFQAVLPASSQSLNNFMYFTDVVRVFAAGGWTVVASNESWMSHSLFFAAYIVFGFALQVSQYILAVRGKQHITHGDMNVRLKLFLLIGQTVSAFLNVTLYIRHARTCSAYSTATFFEWTFALSNVLFDLTNYYDLEHATFTIGSAAASITSGAAAASSVATVVLVKFDESPSELLLWVADLFFGYYFWSGIVHLIQYVYFLPMVAMETTIECATLLFVGSPMLLFFRPLSVLLFGSKLRLPVLGNWVGLRAPGYWWMYVLSLSSLFAVDITKNPYLKITTTSIGTLFLSYGFFLRLFSTSPASTALAAIASGTNERDAGASPAGADSGVAQSSQSYADAVRLLYGLPIGLTISMSLRYMFVSLDPLFTDAFFNAIFGIAFGLFNLVTLYRKAVYGEVHFGETSAAAAAATSAADATITATGDSNTGAAVPAESSADSAVASLSEPLQGLCFGMAAILSVALVTAYGVIPRMLGLDPADGSGLLVIVFFSLGLYFSNSLAPSTNALPMILQRRPTLAAVVTYAPLRSALLVVGFFVMTYATLQSNRVKERSHAHFPTAWDSVRENVDIKDWYAEDMWGSPTLAFVGGLMVVFGLGAAWPPIMAFTVMNLRAKRWRTGGTQATTSWRAPLDGLLAASRFRRSFELAYFGTFFVMLFAHVFVVDHPFITGAWILRDSLHIVLGGNIVILVLLLNYLSIRGSAAGFTPGTATPPSAPSSALPKLSSVVFGGLMGLLLACVLVRVGHQPGSVSIPHGKVTATEHRDAVLSLANQLLDFQSQLNSLEDPNLPAIKKATMTAFTRHELEQFEKAALATHGEEIFNAAKNIAPISGMIWTVHFGLDNFNNDNIIRLAEMAKGTGAGIIGLLESDSQRIINGNRDMVELMAYQLGFEHTDWGPTTFDGTFGCALLTKYPILAVKRYVLPSPLGELACLIHANLDVYGVPIHVYVGHWGNTQHWADGILQSQFLGQLVRANPGPSIFLGYLVSKPEQEKYNFYAKEGGKGMLVDTAKELYNTKNWEKIHHHAKNPSGGEFADAAYSDSDDQKLLERDQNYKRPPSDAPVRYFFFPHVKRYSTAHPRWEYKDRYCQYIFYKTGLDKTELKTAGGDAKHVAALPGGGAAHFQLLDWWRVLDIHELSDTEIQVVQLRLGAGTALQHTPVTS